MHLRPVLTACFIALAAFAAPALAADEEVDETPPPELVHWDDPLGPLLSAPLDAGATEVAMLTDEELAQASQPGVAGPDCPKPGFFLAVDVNLMLGKETLNDTKNRAEIKEIYSKGSEAVYRSASIHPVGLTHAVPHISQKAGVKVTKTSDGRYCAWLTEMRFDFGYKRLDIYIDNKYPPGSCNYNVILDHERQHVQINRRVLREYKPRFKEAMLQSVEAINPLVVSDPEQIQALATQVIRTRFQAVLADHREERNKANAVIDTPTNYRMTQMLCPRW